MNAIWAFNYSGGWPTFWGDFDLPGGRSFAVFRRVGGFGLSSLLVLDSVDGVNPDQSMLQIRVERKAAPGPILRVIDQFSLQRIHVHVVELFNPLLEAPHVKVIKSPLPKPW